MRWRRFQRWCVEAGVAVDWSLVALRYHRLRGRELVVQRSLEPFQPIARIPWSAQLQSADALLLFTLRPGAPEYSTMIRVCRDVLQRNCAREGEGCPRSLPPTELQRDTDEASAALWMLAFVVAAASASAAVVPSTCGAAGVHISRCRGYVVNCLPRLSRASLHTGRNNLVAQLLRHLRRTRGLNSDRGLWMDEPAMVASFCAKAEAEYDRRLRIAQGLMSLWGSMLATRSSPPTSITPERLVWSYEHVISRSHMFSLRASCFSPRRYPLSSSSSSRGVYGCDGNEVSPLTHNATMCPLFDMINDGDIMNVSFVDVPTSTTEHNIISGGGGGGVKEDCHHVAFGKNRDLIIEAGPLGIPAGAPLTMCYQPVCVYPSATRPSPVGQVDVEETLLRFGFLPHQEKCVGTG